MATNETSVKGFQGIEPKILQSFKDELLSQENQPLDLAKWVNEVPSELRRGLFPKLLEIYLNHCVKRGWTVSKDLLIVQFPEFRETILNFYSIGSGEEKLNETAVTRSLETTVLYAVNEQVWKIGGQGSLHKSSEAAVGNRQLVVKFLNDLSRGDNFQKEIEVTAKLDHPGVVAVYSQGIEQDHLKRPFFAMRLIHGKTLEERIAEFHNGLDAKSPRQRKYEFTRSGGITKLIDHVISACNTVSHAHSVGVLHCDLKPRNVVCGKFGATIVLDWGSAMHCDVPDEQIGDSTQRIDLPGRTTLDMTLPYASPEQMEAANHGPTNARLTIASDVFSLGATLYQALTGKTPFNAQRMKDSKSEPPLKKNPYVSKRLDAICVKAMQHSPENRYASAAEFADDLRNWLRDEPIQAVADNFVDRSFRIARHHKGTTIASLALLIVLLVATFAGITMWHKQDQTLHNLDLTLALIEDVCQPLVKGEVQNSKEFDDIADQVKQFTQNYIGQNTTSDDKTLARIFKIKGIVQYHLFNKEGNRSTDSEKRRLHLSTAIECLENAESLYEVADVLSIAETRLTQARWLWSLSQTRSEGWEIVEDCTRAIRKLDQVLKAVQEPGLTGAIAAAIQSYAGRSLSFKGRDFPSIRSES